LKQLPAHGPDRKRRLAVDHDLSGPTASGQYHGIADRSTLGGRNAYSLVNFGDPGRSAQSHKRRAASGCCSTQGSRQRRRSHKPVTRDEKRPNYFRTQVGFRCNRVASVEQTAFDPGIGKLTPGPFQPGQTNRVSRDLERASALVGNRLTAIPVIDHIGDKAIVQIKALLAQRSQRSRTVRLDEWGQYAC
jgi:hypothetical protein